MTHPVGTEAALCALELKIDASQYARFLGRSFAFCVVRELLVVTSLIMAYCGHNKAFEHCCIWKSPCFQLTPSEMCSKLV